MSEGANLSSAAVFKPGSAHASRAYVDGKVSHEAGSRSAADDALTVAIQDVDTKLSVHAADSSHVTQQEKSAWNSKCPLEDGKVPAANLPSFVDDVVEAGDATQFPQTGETGKIYVAKDTNRTYRWGGSGYVEISQSLALGETASTAYPGNKGANNERNIASEVQRASSAEESIRRELSNLTPEDIGAASESHEHTKSQITDFGGPYLPTSGGNVGYLRVNTDTDESGHLIVGWANGEGVSVSSFGGGGTSARINVNGGDEGGGAITVNGSDFGGGAITVNGGGDFGGTITVGGEGASIKKGGKEVATEDQLPYPIAAATMVSDDVYQLRDRTVNTFDISGTFTFPAKVGTASRDFSLVISAQSTAPSVSFPTTGVTYVSEQSASELWSAEANAINEWYFHENGANQFAVYHRAFSTVTPAS